MRTLSRITDGVLVVALLAQLTACGTILYPERRGQIGGKVDIAVVGMDAIGILFFVIPGLIAFGIDFATGAIYLPGGKYSVTPAKLQEAISADTRIDHIRLKAILQHELGRDLPLDDPRLIQHSGSIEQLAALGLRAAT